MSYLPLQTKPPIEPKPLTKQLRNVADDLVQIALKFPESPAEMRAAIGGVCVKLDELAREIGR